MAKLVDAPDLGSGAARRGGSSPSTRTNTKRQGEFLILPTLSLIRVLIAKFGFLSVGCVTFALGVG